MNLNEVSLLSEGHHAEIKELEAIIKNQVSDSALQKILDEDEEQSKSLQNETLHEYPETVASQHLSEVDSLMNLVN